MAVLGLSQEGTVDLLHSVFIELNGLVDVRLNRVEDLGSLLVHGDRGLLVVFQAVYD